MFNINEKTRRLIFRLIIILVFAYLAYIMISYYTSDKVGMVKLSYNIDDTNIMTEAYATYKLKTGEGSLNLSHSKDLDITYPPDILSFPVVLSTDGSPVSEVKLEIIYDDTNINFDEDKISLIDYNAQTGEASLCEYTLDTSKNTVTANVTGNGIWFLATK